MAKRILVAIDGSSHARKAAEFASDLALKYDAAIYLIHVAQRTGISKQEFVKIDRIEELIQKAGEEIIEKAKSEIRLKKVRHLEGVSVLGDPVAEILRYAEEKGVDMIVLGSRGLGFGTELFLGSVSHKVCQLASCTCVTVK